MDSINILKAASGLGLVLVSMYYMRDSLRELFRKNQTSHSSLKNSPKGKTDAFLLTKDSLLHCASNHQIPILDADTLLRPYRHILTMLKDGLGMSEEEWQTIALPVIKNYAEHVQLLPASESDHHHELGGLLLHSLEVAYFSLVECRKVDFSTDISREKKALLSDRWYFATFLASLLHDAGKPVTDLIIFKPDTDIKWNPLIESIQEWGAKNNCDHYWFQYLPNRNYEDHEAVNAMISGRILTKEATDYLSSMSIEILEAFMYALSSKGNPTGRPLFKVVNEIVKKADSTSVSKYKKRYKISGETPRESITLTDQITHVVKELIKKAPTKRWSINTPGSVFFLNETGMFACWDDSKPKEIREFANQIGMGDKIAGLPDIAITQYLFDAGVFFRVEDRKSWKGEISLPGSKWKQKLSLFIVAHPEIIRAAGEKLKKQIPIVNLTDPNKDIEKLPAETQKALEDVFEQKKEHTESLPETESTAPSKRDEKAKSLKEDVDKEEVQKHASTTESQKADKKEMGDAQLEKPQSTYQDKNAQEGTQNALPKKREEASVSEQDAALPKSNETPDFLSIFTKHESNDKSENLETSIDDIPSISANRIKGARNKKGGKKIPAKRQLSSLSCASLAQEIQDDEDPTTISGNDATAISETTPEEFINIGQRLSEMSTIGESGEILSGSAMLMEIGEISRESIFLNGDHVCMRWPTAFNGQGESPQLLMETMSIEGALKRNKKTGGFIHTTKQDDEIIEYVCLTGSLNEKAKEILFNKPSENGGSGSSANSAQANTSKKTQESVSARPSQQEKKTPRQNTRKEKSGSDQGANPQGDKKDSRTSNNKQGSEPTKIKQNRNSEQKKETPKPKQTEKKDVDTQQKGALNPPKKKAENKPESPAKKNGVKANTPSSVQLNNKNEDSLKACKRLFKTFDIALSQSIPKLMNMTENNKKLISGDDSRLLLRKDQVEKIINFINDNSSVPVKFSESALKRNAKHDDVWFFIPKDCLSRSFGAFQKAKKEANNERKG